MKVFITTPSGIEYEMSWNLKYKPDPIQHITEYISEILKYPTKYKGVERVNLVRKQTLIMTSDQFIQCTFRIQE